MSEEGNKRLKEYQVDYRETKTSQYNNNNNDNNNYNK